MCQIMAMHFNSFNTSLIDLFISVHRITLEHHTMSWILPPQYPKFRCELDTIATISKILLWAGYYRYNIQNSAVSWILPPQYPKFRFELDITTTISKIPLWAGYYHYKIPMSWIQYQKFPHITLSLDHWSFLYTITMLLRTLTCCNLIMYISGIYVP